MAVPPERAARYRSEGLWDDRGLADGIEAVPLRGPAPTIALADNARSLTHAELGAAVAAGVSTARAAGLGAGAPPLLVAGNTVDGVVAYHALLRAGVTLAVIDRRCGPADVRHALDVVAPGGGGRAIAPAAERDRLCSGLDVDVVLLEQFGAGARDGRAPAAEWAEPDRDRPAVVLFTSGTTSRPKGAVHSLNTLTAGAANMARITGATEATVIFLVSPLTSIAGIMQMHLAADLHASLVLEDRFEPGASLDRLNRAGATLLGGAPVVAERLLRAAQERGTRRVALRTLALGGAMLPRPLL